MQTIRAVIPSIAMVVLAGLLPVRAEGEALSEHVLFSFKKAAPRLDGAIAGDAAWEATQSAEDFLVLGRTDKAVHATTVRTIWDEDAVYFGVTAETPEGYEPETSHSAIWDNDSMEIWIQVRPDADTWMQLIFDAAGNKTAYRHADGSITQSDMEFQVQTTKSGSGWSAEVAVPFKSLGLDAPENGGTCRFAVHRNDKSVPPQELSSWARIGQFNQKSGFPSLVFSSDWEVSPELAYWNKGRAQEALLRRIRVSAHDLLSGPEAAASTYTLWKYEPAAITMERRTRHAGLETLGLWGETKYWSGYKDLADVSPQFFQAAMGINAGMVALSKLEEDLFLDDRAGFYAAQFRPEAKPPVPQAPQIMAPLMKDLDALYAIYGSAFDAKWDTAQLEGFVPKLENLDGAIRGQAAKAQARLGAIQNEVRSQHPWPAPELRYAPGDQPTDKSGTPSRIHNNLYGAYPYNHAIKVLWDQWDAVNVDWNRTLPESDGKGNFQFPLMTKYTDFLEKQHPGMKTAYHMLFGSYYCMPYPDWLEKKAQEDPDILITTSDGHQVKKRTAGPSPVPIYDGMNINHPFVRDYARDSIKALASQFGDRTAYVVSGWEDNVVLHLPDVSSANGYRTVGYNPTGRKAFEAYLAERYKNIADLNGKWGSSYASFSEVQPPEDKWLKPANAASGLTYEWERFIRMNHLGYSRLIKDAYKEGSPTTPVMIDDSHFLADGNLYWVYKEDIADIYSFHWTPANEDAMWVLMDRLSQRFGKTMGYYENYFPMYTSRVLDDEVKSRAALREFFWRLLVRGNRYNAWWLKAHTGSTEYAIAYGGGLYGLDFDQTILRWSMTILPVMWAREKTIEKALVETQPEPTRVAVLQPDATVLNLSARTMRVSTGLPPITSYLLLHNEFLAPGGYPVDFVTEEMVLDGKASLSEFTTLILANGYWMDPAFSVRLKEWIEAGGRLIAIGPFAMSSPWGKPLDAKSSAFLSAFDPVKRTGSELWSVKLQGVGSDPVVTNKPLGKGTILYLNRSLDTFAKTEAGRKSVSELLASEIPRLAVSDSPDIKLASRVAPDGTVFVFPVNTSLVKDVTGSITLSGSYQAAEDCVIPGGFPVAIAAEGKGSRFSVRLAPGDWTVIKLTPARTERAARD